MTECRFDDRVAVITGGGRGLGRAYAELLASRGAKVVINDNGASIVGDEITENPADELVRIIKAAGGDAVACLESVATKEGGQAIIDTAMDTWGRIDILIHNAGNVRYGALDEISHDDFQAVIDVHMMGAFNVVRPAFPLMKKAGYGRMVLTGSIGGLYGNYRCVNYGMAKAATVGLNNIAALEGSEFGIKSNVILPAAMTRMADNLDTSQYPPMSPELVAPVVGWLCHESCSVNGELLVSAAGRVARAFVTETEGVFKPEWSIEDVAENIDSIRDDSKQWTFHPADFGFSQHLAQSFAMAKSES